MKTNRKKYGVLAIKTLLIASAAIPIVITLFTVITTKQNSVVFLENFNPVLAKIIIAYYIVLIGLGTFLILKKIGSIIDSKKEQKKMELLHLKSQVNPHFFFNMLNAVYGSIATDKEKAQEMVLNLSDLMRYSIYSGQKNSVPIKEEVDYLNKYINLQKLRYKKEINVQFDCKIDNSTTGVMPLLFIILVENAFKHGVENIIDGAYIRMELFVADKNIHFLIENNFDLDSNSEPGGIGLKNLKRRLELAYPKNHTYSHRKKGNIYFAKIKIIEK